MPKFEVKDEYETLREELLQAKKNVFERPLVIAALAIAGLKFIDKEYVVILPVAMSLIALFNYWFTINRLMSAARIVAYIQVVLENKSNDDEWLGWETSLRFYRKWQRKNKSNMKNIIKNELETDALPNSFLYYPPIYYFHIFIILSAVISSVTMAVMSGEKISIIFSVITCVVFLISIKYFYRYVPGKVRTLIEENRVIWINVKKENNNVH